MIVARNAAATVADAVRSVLNQPIDELLLVDDGSTDDTVSLARSLDDGRLRIVEVAKRSTLGHARAVGLAALRSEFCLLLDADDEFLPGRVERLKGLLQGVDFVADEVELVDGISGNPIRSLSIPAFLDEPPGLFRLFERNYLPGIGQIGFRVEFMRRIGYDASAHGVEDTDFVLRALLAGARYRLVRQPGYLMRHFSGSVSRNRERQASELARVLGNHDYAEIGERWRAAGASNRVTQWGLLSLAVFRRDYSRAEAFLDALELGSDGQVLEPDGPCPLPEAWRLSFFRGTLILLRDGSAAEAASFLGRAMEVAETAETLNNLGVSFCRLGRVAEAEAAFVEALTLRPDYSDAKANVASPEKAVRVTAFPLRREPSRSEYS